MPQLRQNLILKEWVIIATDRAKRPDQLKEERTFIREDLPEHDDNCPFCSGSDENSEVEPLPEECGEVRAIYNKYPALVNFDGDVKYDTDSIFRWMDGMGQHEVIIESPVHNETIATMSVEKVKHLIYAYRRRYRQLMAIPAIESVIPFRNHGSRAGASLVHPHSQIIAMPIIPRDVMARMNESIRYHEEHRSCIFCRVMNEELDKQIRVVLENESFVAFIPYAANTPFHSWIYPKHHSSSFEDINDKQIADLAQILHHYLRKLYYGLNDPDYNYIIRSAPKGYGNTAFFHWYITIVPRLTRTAGFELGSGMFINPSIPEENAEYLRSIND